MQCAYGTLRRLIFYKKRQLIVSDEVPLVDFSIFWMTPFQNPVRTTIPEIKDDYHWKVLKTSNVFLVWVTFISEMVMTIFVRDMFKH